MRLYVHLLPPISGNVVDLLTPAIMAPLKFSFHYSFKQVAMRVFSQVKETCWDMQGKADICVFQNQAVEDTTMSCKDLHRHCMTHSEGKLPQLKVAWRLKKPVLLPQWCHDTYLLTYSHIHVYRSIVLCALEASQKTCIPVYILAAD